MQETSTAPTLSALRLQDVLSKPIETACRFQRCRMCCKIQCKRHVAENIGHTDVFGTSSAGCAVKTIETACGCPCVGMSERTTAAVMAASTTAARATGATAATTTAAARTTTTSTSAASNNNHYYNSGCSSRSSTVSATNPCRRHCECGKRRKNRCKRRVGFARLRRVGGNNNNRSSNNNSSSDGNSNGNSSNSSNGNSNTATPTTSTTTTTTTARRNDNYYNSGCTSTNSNSRSSGSTSSVGNAVKIDANALADARNIGHTDTKGSWSAGNRVSRRADEMRGTPRSTERPK